MIKIFGVDETTSDLETLNGDCVLIPSKAILHKYENGDYSLDLEASYDYADYFENNRIVVADLPFNGGMEFFRMSNPTKSRGKCKCKCPQIYNDIKSVVKPYDERTTREMETYYDLLTYINGSSSGFVGGNGSFTIDDYSGSSDFPLQSFAFNGVTFDGVIQDMIKKYGGYLYRNKRHFGVSPNRITTDRGVTIRYGKNLKSLTKEEDWSDVCTYLVAIGSAGVSRTYENQTQYDFKYNKIVKFQQDINPEDYQTEEAYNDAKVYYLGRAARAYFAEHTLPNINYSMDAYIENIDGAIAEVQDIGDQIEVIDEQLGINVMTYVLGFDYNLITKRFTKLEFGNYANTMKGYNNRVNDQIGILEENVTNISYPVGSIYQSGSSANPHNVGMTGYWALLSSSGGVYTWKRVS